MYFCRRAFVTAICLKIHFLIANFLLVQEPGSKRVHTVNESVRNNFG